MLVPPERVAGWWRNFSVRHGETGFLVDDGRLRGTGADGEIADVSLPFGRDYDGPADPAAFAASSMQPCRWGLLLVRKGGFAVAAVDGAEVTESKIGRRHVQGRTKAGGQSQQRFARRRDNQARAAYAAAADHAARILLPAHPEALVCGGDRAAVEAVLADPRLVHLDAVRCEPWLPVPDPRRSVLDQAVADGRSVRIRLPG
ncbi:MAG TPA: acVLRF1 family peptidyl-tRNA hydrolase [Nocardioidaceae bacterium]|nr:acVLRF1 family peptidyl-tRNA hydrolase [Nocardioidaceae bacterium]